MEIRITRIGNCSEGKMGYFSVDCEKHCVITLHHSQTSSISSEYTNNYHYISVSTQERVFLWIWYPVLPAQAHIPFYPHWCFFTFYVSDRKICVYIQAYHFNCNNMINTNGPKGFTD